MTGSFRPLPGTLASRRQGPLMPGGHQLATPRSGPLASRARVLQLALVTGMDALFAAVAAGPRLLDVRRIPEFFARGTGRAPSVDVVVGQRAHQDGIGDLRSDGPWTPPTSGNIGT